MNRTKRDHQLSESEIDAIVVAQAEDDTAWEEPIEVLLRAKLPKDKRWQKRRNNPQTNTGSDS